MVRLFWHRETLGYKKLVPLFLSHLGLELFPLVDLQEELLRQPAVEALPALDADAGERLGGRGGGVRHDGAVGQGRGAAWK